jgi:murein L,D-transpeptidase YafK
MLKVTGFFAVVAIWVGQMGFFVNAMAESSERTSLILVDKKTNTLQLGEYAPEGYKILKTYHATLGQVKGDKETDNDLKTPEGIYTFNTLLKPPKLPKKFGAMSFAMNFPNSFDAIAGRTGNGIMLHATDEPDRLKKNYDSLGCIVVKNEEILEIEPHIRLSLTPILVFSELSEEYLHPGQDPKLTQFMKDWIKSWETKNLDDYMSHYHTEFSANGKNWKAWKNYKAGLNTKYSTIEIGPEDIRYYRHPKYSMVTFTQNYQSKFKRGGWAHRSRGTKILYIAEEQGQPKIIAETYTQSMW